MTKTEFDRLTAGKAPRADRDKLFDLARFCRDRETDAYKSALGADVAEAPAWGYIADTLVLIAEGANIDEAVAFIDAQWRSYAVANNAKIKAAPKIKHGGRAGQSVISHRYTSPDHFLSRVRGYLPSPG